MDVLKRWGSNFMKGFQTSYIAFIGNDGPENMSVRGLVKNIRGLFGAIDDTEDLERDVRERITKKFP